MAAELIYRMSCETAGRGAAAAARLFEQAAGPHAAALGVGIDALRSKGQAWMLVQLGMAVRRWPEPGESVEVVTWPSRRTSGVRAWREFEIVSPLGEKLLEAASVWLIVDLQNRRPVRLPRFLLELEFPPRITAVDFAPVPERPEAAPRVARRTVSPEDLDINNHANNAAYLAWAEAEAEKDSPCSLQVDFLDEALLGEEIRVETWEQAEQGVIQLIMGARGVCACVQWWRGGQEV
jgi:acyl-CoA thioesterase FadM